MSLVSTIKKRSNTDPVVEEDFSGSTFLVDSGVYDFVIDLAYLTKSRSSDAVAMVLKLKGKGGVQLTQTIYFTNRNGETEYTREGQTYNLPGYEQLNALTSLVNKQGLLETLSQAEQKQTMIYDWDARAEVAKTVEMVMPLVGQKVKAGVLKTIEDIGDAQNGYAPTGFSREANVIDKFFDIDSGKTQSEIVNNKEAVQIAKWDARNVGTVKDNTKNKIGFNPKPKAGATPASNQTASAPATPKEDIFGEDDDVPFD